MKPPGPTVLPTPAGRGADFLGWKLEQWTLWSNRTGETKNMMCTIWWVYQQENGFTDDTWIATELIWIVLLEESHGFSPVDFPFIQFLGKYWHGSNKHRGGKTSPLGQKKHCGDCNQSTSSHTRGKSRLLEDMWRFQHSGGRGVPSEADQTDSHMGKKGDVSGITVCWFHCATTFHVFGSIQTRIAVQGTWTHQTDGEVADQLYIYIF